LAYIIAGHHAGLPDEISNDNACLANRLDETRKRIPDYSAHSNAGLPTQLSPPDSVPFTQRKGATGFQTACFIRMLFSCLVDADRLDSEAAEDQDKASRRGDYPALEILNARLNEALRRKAAENPDRQINKVRANILEHCLKAADSPQGLFSLTVPTGGGKTLSSLAFALRHAQQKDLRRVIYVIPFTSIIEQNAAVFRQVLGADAVVEHHSNFDPKGEHDDWQLLATENWDAPIRKTPTKAIPWISSTAAHAAGSVSIALIWGALNSSSTFKAGWVAVHRTTHPIPKTYTAR
jgi:CRISPR-associated endonuclease/helicase Cas3